MLIKQKNKTFKFWIEKVKVVKFILSSMSQLGISALYLVCHGSEENSSTEDTYSGDNLNSPHFVEIPSHLLLHLQDRKGKKIS